MTKISNPKLVSNFEFRILNLFRVSPARLDFAQAKSGGGFGFRVFSRGGFTLIEILVSISVVAMLATIMWQGLFAFKETQELTQSVETALGFLKDTRVRTLASEGGKQYGVHFEEGRFILFEGTSYNPASTTSSFSLTPSIRISNINLTGGGSDVVFERLTGKTSKPGTITFESKRSQRQRSIQIFDSGLANPQ